MVQWGNNREDITAILLLNLQRKHVISLEIQLIHSQEKERDKYHQGNEWDKHLLI